MVADFVRYYTRNKITHGCRFHEILHQNQNISWLHISWDFTPELLYLMAANFMRYYAWTKMFVQEILAILPQKHLLALGRILSISTPKSKHVLWTKVFLSLVETTLSKMIKIKGKGDLGMSWESYLRLTLAILRRWNILKVLSIFEMLRIETKHI